MLQAINKRVTTKSRQAQERQLRQQIVQLLGIMPAEIREWNTCLCPDCHQNTMRVTHCAVSAAPHLPPLFYALAPELPTGDMPLGIGADSLMALTDLLWNVKLDALLDHLAADL